MNMGGTKQNASLGNGPRSEERGSSGLKKKQEKGSKEQKTRSKGEKMPTPAGTARGLSRASRVCVGCAISRTCSTASLPYPLTPTRPRRHFTTPAARAGGLQEFPSTADARETSRGGKDADETLTHASAWNPDR